MNDSTLKIKLKNYKRTKLSINNYNIDISHNMQLTLVDGKVCNAITSTTSAQKFYICKATPVEMNQIEKVTPLKSYTPFNWLHSF
jgi:hypothetical protein